MRYRYVQTGLIIAALALGLAVLATFVVLDAVRMVPPHSAPYG